VDDARGAAVRGRATVRIIRAAGASATRAGLVIRRAGTLRGTTETDGERYRFRNLRGGTYTIASISPAAGKRVRLWKWGAAQPTRSVAVIRDLQFKESDFVLNDAIRRRNTVSTRQLAVSETCLREYRQAAKDLEKHDADAAVKRLEHAVELAPQFADAWNTLGPSPTRRNDTPARNSAFEPRWSRTQGV